MTDDQALMDRQYDLEAEMQGLGVDTFRRRLDSARENRTETATPAALRMLKACVDPVSQGITAFVKDALSGGRGKRATAALKLKDVDPDVAAFITAKVVLDQLTLRNPVQRCAVNVGRHIEDELRFASLKKTDPQGHKALMRRADWIDGAKTPARRRTVMVWAANKAGLTWEKWADSECLHVGMKLLDLFIETTGYVEVYTDTSAKKRTKVYLVATEKTREWLERANRSCEVLTPAYMPTVIPPRPWTSPWEGGYHTSLLDRITLVKTRNRPYLEELAAKTEQLAGVYASVNAIQDTRWAINAKVLDTAAEAWDLDLAIGKVPPRDNLDVPRCPLKEGERYQDLEGEDLQAYYDWRGKAHAVHLGNVKLWSKRMQAVKALHMAEKFRDDVIYFPHQLDFRGRIYAIPLFLQPQGNDLSKGLLTFADKKPINDGVAAGWLAIHGANLYGVDKVSLEDRIGWVEQHNDVILETAADPLANLWWTKTKKPWQFLAFVFDWAGFLAEGYGYQSSLPVALDGSCNGLQNFSAALRDEVGGAAVNMVPAPTPQDIYQQVADRVTDKLRRDTSTGGSDGDLAALWLKFCPEGITREATKRSVMVLPYGGTLYSSRTFVEDYVAEQFTEGHPDVFGDDKFRSASYLAQHIWSSIGEVVIAARAAMAWLRGSASILAKQGLPIVWTTPDGLPVMQQYPATMDRRVKTQIGDQIIKLRLREDIEGLDARRQVSGISPNWVHSLDATHLRMCVTLALANDITAFSMVHDSFGTHAANSELLSQCLRHAFVDMYKNNDVMEDFRTETSAVLPDGEELPPTPPRGTLEIEGLLESDFFFA